MRAGPGYAYDRINDGELQPTSLDAWESVGLPWIVFWFKELLSWGTLDPVAAFLLGRGLYYARAEAEHAAQQYYTSEFAASRSDPLDARSIRDWVESTFPTPTGRKDGTQRREFQVKVTDQSVLKSSKSFRVFPLHSDATVRWADVGGYILAESASEIAASIRELGDAPYDFLLDPPRRMVVSTPYL